MDFWLSKMVSKVDPGGGAEGLEGGAAAGGGTPRIRIILKDKG